MIFANFMGGGGGKHHHGGGGRRGGGGYYPMPYSTPAAVEYITPVILAPPASTGPCATWPTPPPPCPNGKLVWTSNNTVCCK